MFSVSDNGVGFEQQHADYVFNPSKRLHSRDQHLATA
jgi:light-regulated signal transduction histidine kinase (bacteriophytochrome)